MDIINLIGGLLYQWDTGRKVKIESPSCINVDEVHFTNDMQDALVVEPKSADNVYYAEIPNILLQDKRRIKVYVVTRTETGEQTVCCRGLTVNPRQKPADYIYTETELKRWESLDERIKALEEGGVGGSADAVLYTEQELTEEQKAVARENIGAVGAPQTAEVGQVISVKAVDDKGKPMEWECVDRTWNLLSEITLEESSQAIDISEDINGNPFAVSEILVELHCPVIEDIGYGYVRFGFNEHIYLNAGRFSYLVNDVTGKELYFSVGFFVADNEAIIPSRVAEGSTGGSYQRKTIVLYGPHFDRKLSPAPSKKIEQVSLTTGIVYPAGTEIRIYYK